jgi:hypothetical protein
MLPIPFALQAQLEQHLRKSSIPELEGCLETLRRCFNSVPEKEKWIYRSVLADARR